MNKIKLVTILAFTLQSTTLLYAGGTPDASFNLSPYIGFGTGTTNLSNSSATDSSDSQHRLHGGAFFNKNFGIELGYANLGNYQSRFTSTTWEYTAYYASLIAKYPLNNKFDITGKLGVAKFDVDYSTSAPNRDGTEAMFGIGAIYKLNKKVGITADYMRFDFDPIDVDTFSVGINYNFQ